MTASVHFAPRSSSPPHHRSVGRRRQDINIANIGTFKGLEAPIVAFMHYGNLTIVPLNNLDWARVREGELPDAADRAVTALPDSVCFIKCGIQPYHIAGLSRNPPLIVFFLLPFPANRACN